MKWDQNSKIKNSVLEAVGYSPLIRLNRLSADVNADILVKMEFVNPSGSLRDRVVAAIVENAEQRGELKTGHDPVGRHYRQYRDICC